jgi:hypothetical protein
MNERSYYFNTAFFPCQGYSRPAYSSFQKPERFETGSIDPGYGRTFSADLLPHVN